MTGKGARQNELRIFYANEQQAVHLAKSFIIHRTTTRRETGLRKDAELQVQCNGGHLLPPYYQYQSMSKEVAVQI